MSDEIISNKSRDEKLIRIGLNIRKIRRVRDITQDDLAKALKVSRSTIGCIESKTNPYRISIDLLLDITEYFGISPSELFEGV